MASAVGVGVIGAGTISDTYLENLTRFADTEVLAIGDLVTEAAREKAAKYDVPATGDVATVLDHSGVEIVVNLTIPAAHAEVATRAVAAGKHVWNEKPLAWIASAARACSATLRRPGCSLAAPPTPFWDRDSKRPAGLSSRA
jgi:predicted dehydrogenase